MSERIYTISELKQLISESAKTDKPKSVPAKDFKPRLGAGVEDSNQKENSKTYDAAKKRAHDFDGGGNEVVEERMEMEKEDDNATTLDYLIDGAPDEDFRKKVKAQAEGYTSVKEKNNGIEKSGKFSDFSYKEFKASGERRAAEREYMKKSGLVGRGAQPDKFKKDGLYSESKKIAVLNFKNTTFLNESQMISRIPDDYKIDGNRFKVRDAGENEFIVEWKEGEASILSYENKKKLNESIEKFHKLSGYKSKEQFKTSSAQSRLNESTNFDSILNKARILAENKK